MIHRQVTTNPLLFQESINQRQPLIFKSYNLFKQDGNTDEQQRNHNLIYKSQEDKELDQGVVLLYTAPWQTTSEG
jgi:hypothetical protein